MTKGQKLLKYFAIALAIFIIVSVIWGMVFFVKDVIDSFKPRLYDEKSTYIYTETKEQEINGVTKPKLEVTTDGGDNFVIRATDEQGLKKVEFIINETEKYRLNLDGRTELDYAYPLHDGENKLEVRVYNVNDVSEVSKVVFNK